MSSGGERERERERESERERIIQHVCCIIIIIINIIIIISYAGEADLFYMTMADEIGLDFKSWMYVYALYLLFLSSYSVYQYGHCRV